MDDYATTHSNITRGEEHVALEPSVWSLVKERLDSMITQAFQRTHVDKLYSSRVSESLRNFTLRLEQLLEGPLKDVAPGHNEGKTIHQKVEDAVGGAVDEVMHEQNVTDAFTSNASLVSVRERLVMTLGSEIELDVFNKVFTNQTDFPKDREESSSGFLHNLHMKDETMFVVLLCMAVIIPVIFISLLIIFFYKRQNDAKEGRQEMLLQDQPEFSMDEYNIEDRQPTLKIEIPDLDLHNLKI